MATTPNYSWVMPAPTDFVTDLPADFEIFGDAVDASLYALSPGTTAGDLDYYTSSTAKARLAIGTAGQVLQVNSGATAPEWATPAGGGKNFTLLNSGNTSLNGVGTLTISGISNVDNIWLDFALAESVNASSELWIRFNSDTGNNYVKRALLTKKTSTYSSANTIGFSSGAANVLDVTQMGTSSSDWMFGGLLMHGCSTAGVKVGTFFGAASGTDAIGKSGVFRYMGTSPITSVSIISQSGNFDGGTVEIYGA